MKLLRLQRTGDSYHFSNSRAVYASAVNTYFRLLGCLLLFQVTSPPRARREFHWDWHQSQSLFSAPSLKDAKIAASERAALAKAIEAQSGAPDPHDPEMASEDQVRQVVLNANIKMISLSQDEKERPKEWRRYSVFVVRPGIARCGSFEGRHTVIGCCSMQSVRASRCRRPPQMGLAIWWLTCTVLRPTNG